MEYPIEKIRIAGNKTNNDWEILKKSLDLNNDLNWEDAYDFFEKRITTRYLRPIETIINMNMCSGEGFAVVNLQCSLIETIESFYNGWMYEYNMNRKVPNYKRSNGDLIDINNRNIFISFFNSREPFAGLMNGGDFYENVRCGLLHETQTKNGWKIKARHPDPKIFYEEDKNDKILYRNNLQSAIEIVLHRYKRAIVFGEPYGVPVRILRENFIAKFNHICDLSIQKS